MNSPVPLFIFIFVLFLYIHINYQYKKSQDLEIYEFEYNDTKGLQETCDVRQPIVFHFESLISKYAPINLAILKSVEKEDGNILNIKDIHDYYKVLNSNSIQPIKVPLSFQSVIQLVDTNTTDPHFFSENNHEFIEETGIDTVMTKIGDKFLKPNYTVNQSFDIMTASKGVGLPMKFHTLTRKYIYVTSGRIVVKMAPFKYVKKLDFNKQFLVSPMNCWKPQLQYIPYINKVRFLEFEVFAGYMLYIPPYWIYSIFYVENDTCLLEYNYQTLMNMLAHPDGVVHSFKNALQCLVNIVDSFGSGGGGGGMGSIINSTSYTIPPTMDKPRNVNNTIEKESSLKNKNKNQNENVNENENNNNNENSSENENDNENNNNDSENENENDTENNNNKNKNNNDTENKNNEKQEKEKKEKQNNKLKNTIQYIELNNNYLPKSDQLGGVTSDKYSIITPQSNDKGENKKKTKQKKMHTQKTEENTIKTKIVTHSNTPYDFSALTEKR